jgi:hypothetical protein
MLLGDLADRRRHGGGEQCHLTLWRRRLQYFFDVVDKAHAQHFIGFVEHDESQFGEIQRATVQVIDHAPRCADHDMHATT